MLESIHLENFRGFENHLVPLRQMAVIVGANNAGKSTLVEAVRLVAAVMRSLRGAHFVPEPRWLDHPLAFRGASPGARAIDLDRDGLFHRYEDPPAVITARFTGGASIVVFAGPEGEVHGVFRDAYDHALGSASDVRRLTLPTITVQPQVAPLLRSESILAPATVRRAVGTYLSSQHFRNQLNLYFEDFEIFRTLAERTWPLLEIRELEGQGGLPGDELRLDVRDDDFVGEVSLMGHGLQMWLQTIWFLARAPRAATVILDEPDVYMHPDLQHRLLDEIRDRFRQLVVATHSVELMASVDPQNILVVNRRAAASAFATTLPAVQAAIDQLGGVHNLQLTRLWQADRFLLVEGDDVQLLRVLERKLRVRPSSIGVIPRGSTGGWGGWSMAVTSKLPTTNADGGRIASYALFDRDYHTDEEISERYAEAQERGVRLHIWSRKELENYLLVPDAIARHISALDVDRPSPSADEVQEKMFEIAEQIRDDVEIAIADELHKRDRAGGTPKAMRQAKKRVAEAYETPGGILAIVPGKAMISLLSAWSHAEFGTTFGPQRLVHEFRPHEIAREVRLVLRAIAGRMPFPKEFTGPA